MFLEYSFGQKNDRMNTKSLKLLVLVCFMAFGLYPNRVQSQGKTVVVKGPRKTLVRTGPRPAPIRYRGLPTARMVRAVPRGAVRVRYAGMRYYYSRGLFYRYYNGAYYRIAAPIGFRLSVLPPGYVAVVIGGVRYFFANGNYFIPVDGAEEYEVVDPPKDAIVSTLPEDAEIVDIEGRSLYLYGGTFYKVVTTPEGKAFQVVGSIDD